MKHIVICKYCNQKFDRDKEPYVLAGARRYAHKSCAEKIEESIPQEEKDYNNLEIYIKKLFKIERLNAKTIKQIKDFKENYGYSYTGILKTLYWWYEIKNHTTELAKDGIGIVPFIYEDAERYYYTIYLAQQLNSGIENYKTKTIEVEIPPPESRNNSYIKLFKI